MNDAVKLAHDINTYISTLDISTPTKNLIVDKLNSLLKEQALIKDKSLREFTFDLHKEDLKKYYSETNPNKAWTDVRIFMLKNGFIPKSDSDYISKELITEEYFGYKMNKLRNTFQWFEVCTNKIIASNLTETYDIKKIWSNSRTIDEMNELKESLSKKVVNKNNKITEKYKDAPEQ